MAPSPSGVVKRLAIDIDIVRVVVGPPRETDECVGCGKGMEEECWCRVGDVRVQMPNSSIGNNKINNPTHP